MRRLFSFLVDALLPPHEDVRLARSLTEAELAELLSPRTAGAEWIFSLFPYHDKRVRGLIRAIKYYGETEALQAPAQALGEYVLEMLSEKKLLSGWENPMIIPMPASRERLRERGYNQAQRIAEAALPVLENAAEYKPRTLARENRESQVRVERSKRKENIEDAFFVPDPIIVSGRFVILIDDVVESGSTFADARRALFRAGAKEVIAIALAH